MIIDGRTIQLKESFTSQLATIQDYISQFNTKKGHDLTTSIVNYLVDIIASNSYTFPEYIGRTTPEKMYRRAVFKRKYVVVYKVQKA